MMGAGNWDHHPGNRRFITNFKNKDVKEVMMMEEKLMEENCTWPHFEGNYKLHIRRNETRPRASARGGNTTFNNHNGGASSE